MTISLLITGLFLISAIGIVLYFFRTVNQNILHLLIALGAGTMFSVALVHILPEALEQSPLSVYTFVAGFLLIYLLEEILTTHHHDHKHHDHTHEDPHEHFRHVVIVSWIAIVVHTLFDGLGIRAWFAIDAALGLSILSGIAIHQIPVSLSIASMLRESDFQKRTQILFIIFFGLAAPLGFILSDGFIDHISLGTVGLATAFAGGSLLYVSNVELLPMIHSQSSKKMKYFTVVLFVIGVVGMSAVRLLE